MQSWIRKITDQEMPIFGRTVQEVISISEDDQSSAAHLGQVVLKDASMTSRILKLANSTYYNPSRQTYSTISRAIMMLGFDTVRNMCLTVSLIDSLVQGVNREYLVREIARSLHAATQARMLAEARGEKNVEEIFISTLLLHVGDLAFWCFCGKEGEKLNQAIKDSPHSAERVQREVLGFSLSKLSAGLAKEWGLSRMLQNTLNNPGATDARTQTIQQSYAVAEAAEKGWDSEQMAELTDTLADITGLAPKLLTAKLHHCAKEAADNSTYYGAKFVADVIPVPPSHKTEAENAELPEASPYPDTDPGLQLKILRELASISASQVNFNVVVEMILEGIHRGIGMDRALFALLTPDRKALRSKYVLGDPQQQLSNAFNLSTAAQDAHLAIYAMRKNEPLWIDQHSPGEYKKMVTAGLKKIIHTDAFFLAPIVVKNKPIGVFYADRQPSLRPLDQDIYDSFQHFTQQANLVLNHLAS